MGNVTTSKINFENVQDATKTKSIILINTLSYFYKYSNNSI